MPKTTKSKSTLNIHNLELSPIKYSQPDLQIMDHEELKNVFIDTMDSNNNFKPSIFYSQITQSTKDNLHLTSKIAKGQTQKIKRITEFDDFRLDKSIEKSINNNSNINNINDNNDNNHNSFTNKKSKNGNEKISNNVESELPVLINNFFDNGNGKDNSQFHNDDYVINDVEEFKKFYKKKNQIKTLIKNELKNNSNKEINNAIHGKDLNLDDKENFYSIKNLTKIEQEIFNNNENYSGMPKKAPKSALMNKDIYKIKMPFQKNNNFNGKNISYFSNDYNINDEDKIDKNVKIKINGSGKKDKKERTKNEKLSSIKKFFCLCFS